MTSLGMGGRARALQLGALIGGLTVALACGDGRTRAAEPAIEVSPASLFFGPVALGDRASRTLRIASVSNVSLSVRGAQLEPLGTGTVGDAFSIEGVPLQLAALRAGSVTVSFAPTAEREEGAVLVLLSDDPQRPRTEITLVGRGVAPSLAVSTVCEADCVGSATREPLALHFGPEPALRAQPLPLSRLPGVRLHNDGSVPVAVTGLSLEGPDAEAFTVAADVLNGTDASGSPALILAPGAAEVVPLRFTPAAPDQALASATLVVRSSAAVAAEVRVALQGSVAANAPPVVCANLIRVEGRTPGTFDDEASWAPLRTVPGGSVVDLSQLRDVRPSSRDAQGQWVPTRVFLSAHSPGGAAACTSDLEDGREGLTYSWQLVSAPSDAPALQAPGAALTALELGARAGLYEVRLEVADRGGLTAQRTLRFLSIPKDDLVVELSWQEPGGEGTGVDLDLHLVRPTASVQAGGAAFAGAFDDFQLEPATGAWVSGDLNGRAVLAAPVYGPNAGFDWGGPGQVDDPRFSGDDTGAGALVEVIALDLPEHDAACANSACRYGVYVQHFEDRRVPAPSPTCTVTGVGTCVDGARCDCSEPAQRCVATLSASSGPRVGSGTCRRGPAPSVSIQIRGRVLATVPLEGEALRLGAPCELLHVADVVWPARSSPADSEPVVEVKGATAGGERTLPSRSFGRRGQGGGLTCQPNAGLAPQAWYVEDP